MGEEIIQHCLALDVVKARVFPEVVRQCLDQLLPRTLREKLRWEDHVTTAAFLLDYRIGHWRDAFAPSYGGRHQGHAE
jgi:hypothetical protein